MTEGNGDPRPDGLSEKLTPVPGGPRGPVGSGMSRATLSRRERPDQASFLVAFKIVSNWRWRQTQAVAWSISEVLTNAQVDFCCHDGGMPK